MDQVSRELIVGPAKAVNPKVKVIIKFPTGMSPSRTMATTSRSSPLFLTVSGPAMNSRPDAHSPAFATV